MPHIERRRFVRRAISGGVLFSALAVLPLCVFEVFYVLIVRRPALASVGEGLSFAGYLLLLLVSLAAAIGAAEGLIVLGVSQLTKLLAKRRLSEPRWMAWIYSLLALPGIAVVVAKTFAGRRAQQIAGKDLIAIGLGVAMLVACYLVLRGVIGVRDRFRIRRWGPRQAAWLLLPLYLVALALYVADQRVLAGLYGFFHVGLAFAAFACCQLAAGALYASYRPTARWIGRLAEPSLALLVLLASVAGGAWSLSRVSKSEALRFLYFQHTTLQSKALTLATSLRLVRFESRSGPRAPAAQPAEAREVLMPGPRRAEASLVLISVDALRADHMGIYGYRRSTTPRIDAWAKQAAVFERAYCQVPHTSFSVTSLITGTYVYALSSVDPGRRCSTMPDVLRRYGYKTAGFFPPAVFYIDRQSFTAYERSMYGFEYVKFEYLDAARRVDQALSFLREHRGRRVFVWLHFFEPHEPYEERPDHSFGARAVDRYDGEIAYVDQQIGRLIDRVRRDLPQTYVGLTADHGEEFGEHGAHYHGNNLYDPQVRVPLIIAGPGIAPRRIRAAAQVIDLPVTMLSLVDVPLAAEMRGTDLGPWLAGEREDRMPPAFFEMERKKAVVHRGHKLLCDTARDFCELYDLQNDPGETVNLVARRRALALELRARLDTWLSSHVPRREGRDPELEVATLLNRGRQMDPGAVPGLLKLLAGDPEVKREAARLLTQMRAKPARAGLERAAHDPDPAVRNQARVGAALLGGTQQLTELTKLLARPDLPPSLRRDALLARVRAGDRGATLALAELLTKSEDVYARIEMIEALGALGDPAAGPALRGQLATLRTRLYALQALGEVKARVALPELIKSLHEDRFTSWRKASARSLGQIGDLRARADLQRALIEEVEADVVVELLGALRKMEHGLPVPGTTPIPVRSASWACGALGCTLAFGRGCESVRGRELLLAAGSGPQAAGAPRISLRCGDRELSRATLGEAGAALLAIPRNASGAMVLHAAGVPALRALMMRSAPRPRVAPTP
jgi:arylsulfatase A-like enzyme